MIAALLLASWLTWWRDTNSHAAAADGAKAWAKKQYPAAVDSYRKANEIAPAPARAFNLGTAEIAAGNREGGSTTISAAMRDPALRADALFNRGNAALSSNAYDYAIRDYVDALKLRPSDAAAKRNLEIALRKRAMEQRTSAGGGDSNQQQQQKPQPQPDQKQEQPQSDPDAEALLRSVQQQEQEELSRMNRPARRKARVGW